jgi:hypothetical protein
MKTLLLTMCSPTYYPLGQVTRPNHLAYAAARGYESRCLDIAEAGDYGGVAGERARLNGVLAAFEEGFEQVLFHGVDILFTNHTKTLESIAPGSPVVVAREDLRWWPLNYDVVIWRKGDAATRLLHRLLADEPVWAKLKWLVQTHLWNLLKTDAKTAQAVALVPARAMNSTAQPNAPLSRWQLGDFIIHFLDMPLEERIRTAKAIIELTGPHYDGTLRK